MRRVFLIFAFALLVLAGCQLALPGRDGPAAAANPITGGSITTTTLDTAPTATPAAAQVTTQAPTPPDAEATESQAAATDADEQGTVTAPAATPAVLKSASQIACEEDGGTWARAGPGGGMACVRQTRDGGKQCNSKDDCSGECLARSRTCAPIQPLFGCNAVLMDNGAEVSLCID
jgi:hypothetical protein